MNEVGPTHLYEVRAGGFIARWLDFSCRKPTCACRFRKPKVIVVADEDQTDVGDHPQLWFPFMEHDGPVDRYEDIVGDVLEGRDELNLVDLAQRAVVLLGVPWGDLVARPTIVTQMEIFKALNEGWFLAQPPEQLARFRKYTPSLVSVGEALNAIQDYVTDVGGRRVDFG